MKKIKALEINIAGLKRVEKNLNEYQINLKKSINEIVKTSNLSYSEINEVLYLIDREQQYLATHRR